MGNQIEVILSHGTAGYESSEKLYSYLPEQDAEYAAAYIGELTKYADSPAHITCGREFTSYFTTGNYAVFHKCFTKTDGRYFVESNITLRDEDADGVHAFLKGNGVVTGPLKQSLGVKLYKWMLQACFSDRTVVYVLVDTEEKQQSVKALLYWINTEVLSMSKIADITYTLPSVAYSIAICNCLTPADKTAFMNAIERRQNTVVFDYTGNHCEINVKVPQPDFATAAWQTLEERKNVFSGNDGVKSLHGKLKAFFSEQPVSLAMLSEPGYKDAVAFRFMAKYYQDVLPYLTVTPQEKAQMKKYL